MTKTDILASPICEKPAIKTLRRLDLLNLPAYCVQKFLELAKNRAIFSGKPDDPRSGAWP